MDMGIFAIGLVKIYKYPLRLPRVTNSKMIKIAVESLGLFLVFPKLYFHQLIVFVPIRFLLNISSCVMISVGAVLCIIGLIPR